MSEFKKLDGPDIILDDLGLDHEFYIPLPGKYKKRPCKCGVIHSWLGPKSFTITCEIEEFPNWRMKKCLTCQEVLMLEKVCDEWFFITRRDQYIVHNNAEKVDE